MSSCTRPLLTGFYRLSKQTPHEESADHIDDKCLELKKDSTFIYEVFNSHYNGDDVGADYYSFLGKGIYQVINKKLILNFDENFNPNWPDTLKLNPRFVKKRYKIEESSIRGKQVLRIRFHKKGTVTVGDMSKIK